MAIGQEHHDRADAVLRLLAEDKPSLLVWTDLLFDGRQVAWEAVAVRALGDLRSALLAGKLDPRLLRRERAVLAWSLE